jgi:hypothetical protein
VWWAGSRSTHGDFASIRSIHSKSGKNSTKIFPVLTADPRSHTLLQLLTLTLALHPVADTEHSYATTDTTEGEVRLLVSRAAGGKEGTCFDGRVGVLRNAKDLSVSGWGHDSKLKEERWWVDNLFAQSSLKSGKVGLGNVVLTTECQHYNTAQWGESKRERIRIEWRERRGDAGRGGGAGETKQGGRVRDLCP